MIKNVANANTMCLEFSLYMSLLPSRQCQKVMFQISRNQHNLSN
jgi:hypothetical protein